MFGYVDLPKPGGPIQRSKHPKRCPATALQRRNEEITMNIRLGSAPDSWGVWFPSDPKQIPWQRFLDEIAEAGYEWTQLGPYGYFPAEFPTLPAELPRRRLKVTASLAMGPVEDPEAWPALEKQALGGGELLAALGGRFLVLIDDTYSDPFTGQATRPSKLGSDAWKRLIDATHKMADMAKDKLGLQMVYHPHA